MKFSPGQRFRALLALLVLIVAAGCASSPSDPPSVDTAKKRRYVYLPPETGSMIPRRVEITEDGTTNAAPKNVRNYGAGAIEGAGRGHSVPPGAGGK